MRQELINFTIAAVFTATSAFTLEAVAKEPRVQLGPRPYYLVDKMDEGSLKEKLQKCEDRSSFHQTDFSIGHRVAEHCSSLSTPKRATRQARAWALAYLSVT